MIQQLKTKYELYESVEEMLSPESLSEILNRPISKVAYKPFNDAGGVSGSQLYKVTVDNQPLIMKCMKPQSDWLALATVDTQCRAIRLWQYGILDQLNPYMDHVTLTACNDNDGYALLMSDISAGLHSLDHQLTFTEVRAKLDALAAMHGMFWNSELLHNPQLGLADTEHTITILWPSNINRYGIDETIAVQLSKEWDILFDLIEPDVRDAIQILYADPKPLINRLHDYPSTLIHGDYRTNNLATHPDSNRPVTLDWQFVGCASPILDLFWFLNNHLVYDVFPHGAEYYREQLATRLGSQYDLDIWQPMFDIGSLAGVMRQAHLTANFSTKPETEEKWRNLVSRQIDTFNDIVRRGLKWL